ncbi:hypothetical protein RN22_18990 [Grimontia sp. AD028]|uniref:DUF4260 domain-containing protein n=1 Tax=Grimontia sp. AD028 TaxID=1581149 RepID=UPI00061A9518|nr:DUF4260 domain-containing protein [Grimontia sp. AD028]KKD58857.1 hypothetical protein RN22_18990 [Grimontia sp. AD028]
MSFVTGKLKLILRLEGLCIFLISLSFFNQLDGDWAFFAWLFLLPDLAFLGYLAGPKVGAIAYNITHSIISSAIALAIGIISQSDLVVSLSLIWFAHIGFDRALGYGLKYSTGFSDTHLGRIGKHKSFKSNNQSSDIVG